MISYLQLDLAFIDGPEHYALQHEFDWSWEESLARAIALWAWTVRTEPSGIIKSPHAGRMVLGAMRVVTRNVEDVTRNVALLVRTRLVEPLPNELGLRVRGASRYLSMVEATERRKAQVRERVRKYRQRQLTNGNARGNALQEGYVTPCNAQQDKTRQEKKDPPPPSSVAANGTERQVTRSARRGGRGKSPSTANGHAPAAPTTNSPEADGEPHGAEALEAWAALVHRASQLDAELAPRPSRAFAAWWADAKSIELDRLVDAFARFVRDVRAGALGKRAGPSFELFARPAVWRQRLPPPPPKLRPVKTMSPAEEAWKSVLELVEDDGKQYAKSWLDRLEAKRLIGTKLELEARDEFFASWVKENYDSMLKDYGARAGLELSVDSARDLDMARA